ncbi:MAG: hypothetical protein R3174_04985, partial [Gammaproteobacteria bacterium]|nr:hypothetical protein [Gammaproteobacteria bacterium]
MTTRNSDSTGDALEEQRERLEQLRIWEHEIEALEATEAELEVEKIGADVALERAAEKSDFGIDSRHAAEIAASMARKRELERELAGESVPDTDAGPPVGPSPEKLRAGIAALEDWLGASASAERWRRPGLIYTVLAVALVCTVAAALMLHMILLVLLVPIATAVGYLAFTERDADWIRLGAVRRFEQTRLRPPDPWETETVRSRMTELETALREEQVRAAAPVPEHQPTEDEAEARNRSELAIAMELVAVTDRLDAAIRDSGLDPARMDDELTG